MVVHDETTFLNARVLIGLYLGPLSPVKLNWPQSAPL